MFRVGLVIVGIVLLVATGIWLTMSSEPDVVTVEPDIVNVEPDVIVTETVGDQQFDESMLAAGTAPSTPAPQEFGELLIVVRDAAAYPLADVRITLASIRDVDDRSVGITGPTGEVAFGPILTGSYNYEIEAPNRPPLVSAQPITISTGQPYVLELQLDDHAELIRGRVVDADGMPVAAIGITAKAYRSGREVRLRRDPQAVVTDVNGAFEVRGLAPGEYEVQTRETERYASVKAIVRAGSLSAVLMVAEQRLVKLVGEVRDAQSLPLAGVRVLPLGQSGADTDSDALGYYEVTLKVDDAQQRYYLRFRHSEHREALISVDRQDWAAADVVVRDVTLEPIGETVAVSGRLRDSRGNWVTGEQVHLSSSRENVHYQTQSDQLGFFTFPKALAGNDYRLWVRPRGKYNDYTRDSIDITTVPMQLDVVLEALATGSIAGRVVDRQGGAVPRLALVLYSAQAPSRPIELTSDANGAFKVPEVPAGTLTFKTRSSPRLHLENVELNGGEEKYVEIVLDKGWETLRGEITDAVGYPIGGAQVRLYGSDDSSSDRTQHSTVTDSYGSFNFSALGGGPYRLDITAPGFRRFTQSLEPSQDYVKARLEPQTK